ncbi:hypothetical protein HMPREF0204_11193, partial [Chryseobacterium gleum ATCC 35910]
QDAIDKKSFICLVCYSQDRNHFALFKLINCLSQTKPGLIIINRFEWLKSTLF